MFKTILVMACLFSLTITAGTRDDVTMPDTIKLADKDLVLNGMTTRKASKMGIKVKVYVGGMYLTKKSKSADEIIASDDPKKIVMHYIFFRAPKKKIRKGWKTAFKDHCAADCKTEKAHLKTFNKQVVTMTKNDKMNLEFYKDKLVVEVVKKKKTTSVEIPSRKFANIILKAFVKAKNPNFLKPLMGME